MYRTGAFSCWLLAHLLASLRGLASGIDVGVDGELDEGIDGEVDRGIDEGI